MSPYLNVCLHALLFLSLQLSLAPVVERLHKITLLLHGGGGCSNLGECIFYTPLGLGILVCLSIIGYCCVKMKNEEGKK